MKNQPPLAMTKELTVAEAAEVLGLDRRTVKKLIEQGVLRARLASPPGSLRLRYRLPTEEVVAYRNSYQTFQRPSPVGEKQAAPRRRPDGEQLPHIRLRRGG